MLFCDDIVADRKTEPRPFARWLGGEERIEYLLLHLGRDTSAIVANPDVHRAAEISRRCTQRWLKTIASGFLTLRGCIKAVCNQIQEYPGDFLRIDVDCPCSRIKLPLERHIEARLFCSCTVIGEVEAFVDHRIDVRR